MKISLTVEVEDFNFWYESFMGKIDIYSELGVGIVEISRGIYNPNLIHIGFEADDLSDLMEFLAAPQCIELMKVDKVNVDKARFLALHEKIVF